ncbi:hypothetical protein IL306_013132 [Fusarium sp. DS 682]|nr:hypothetical protein IL306_013132 [Fusarium sp. DS 682]
MARYFLSGHEKAQADVTIKAGVFGYAVNAAAFGSVPSIINLILDQEGSTVDVKDDMGRMPIHLAACNGLANFEAILARGGDVNAKDKQGRTPLHWAAQTGKLQVVRKIISLMGDKLDIDVPDIDGWTPLCWAPRHSLTLLKPENAGETSRAADVVRLLLEHGAKRNVVVKQGEETWTPLGIARYHRSDSEIISVLERGTEPDENGDGDANDKEVKEVKAGRKIGVQQEGSCCDHCLSQLYGQFWICETCDWLCLCAKCYQHADILHREHDEFTLQGKEECKEGEQEASGTGTSGSSDTYSNSDSGSGSDESERDREDKEEKKENEEEKKENKKEKKENKKEKKENKEEKKKNKKEKKEDEEEKEEKDEKQEKEEKEEDKKDNS